MKITEHIEYLLRQGRKPAELVELGFPKRVVTRVHRQFKREKSAGATASLATAKSETPDSSALLSPAGPVVTVPTPQPASPPTAAEWASLLPAVTALIAAAEAHGAQKRRACPYLEDDICIRHRWADQVEIPQGMGEPIPADLEEGGWYIRPSSFYCAMCIVSLEDDVAEVEGGLSGDPLSGARRQITCKSCGSKGYIAVAIKCTRCDHQAYWGWLPKNNSRLPKT